jgi:hypothetical protein
MGMGKEYRTADNEIQHRDSTEAFLRTTRNRNGVRIICYLNTIFEVDRSVVVGISLIAQRFVKYERRLL